MFQAQLDILLEYKMAKSYKKANQKLEERLKELEEHSHKSSVAFRNMIMMPAAIGILFNLLDKLTSIPLSMEDGLSANFYLLPMIFVGLFYLVYGFLWQAGKVKGRLMIYP